MHFTLLMRKLGSRHPLLAPVIVVVNTEVSYSHSSQARDPWLSGKPAKQDVLSLGKNSSGAYVIQTTTPPHIPHSNLLALILLRVLQYNQRGISVPIAKLDFNCIRSFFRV
jgi:hypothetical protein